MKKLLILFVLITASAAGQEFAPLGARWYYNSMGLGAAPSRSEYTRLEVVKDTSINGIACRKIEATHFEYCSGDSVARQPYFVRESGDTAYYWHSILQRFSPLCMFNAFSGDTLTFDVPPYAYVANQLTQFQVVVDSVIPFIQGNDTLKAFYTSPIWQGFSTTTFAFHEPYLEKVGPTFLFEHQSASILVASDGPLRCYSDNNLSINLMGIPCDYRLVASTPMHDLSNYRVYPNPVSDYLTLELPDDFPVHYEIYDLKGRRLQTGICQTAGSNQIDMQLFGTGIYVLHLQIGQQINTHKVVRK